MPSRITRTDCPRAVARRGLAYVAVLAAALSGCDGEDPAVAKARESLSTTASASPEHAEFGATLIAANRTPAGEEVLAALVAADNNQIARAAIRPIVEDPPASLQVPLRAVFDTRRGLLKLDAGIALAHLGDAEALAWVEEEVLARGGVSMTLSAFKLLAAEGREEALTELARKRLGNADASIRNEAYRFLSESGQDWALPLMIEGLGDEVGGDREPAIVWIGATRDPAAAAAVEKHLRTRGLVFTAIEALGDLGNPDSIPKLKRSLKSDTEVVRLYAAVALWKLGDAEAALPVLEPMVTSESADLRGNLALQLARVPAPDATAMLIQLAEDEDPQVRIDAIRALVDRDTPEVQALMLGALEGLYQIQPLALDNLTQFGGVEHVELIEPLIENPNPYTSMSAANAILAIKNRAPAA